MHLFSIMDLTNTLSTTAWAMHHFGSVCTGGNLQLRDIKRAISKGLIESVGSVPICDGDGFAVLPERYREGFRLTDAGKDELRERDPQSANLYLENA